VNSPPPKPEVILTNFFAEPTVLLVPITSRDKLITKIPKIKKKTGNFFFTKKGGMGSNEGSYPRVPVVKVCQ
jgi:hypothetical protein